MPAGAPAGAIAVVGPTAGMVGYGATDVLGRVTVRVVEVEHDVDELTGGTTGALTTGCVAGTATLDVLGDDTTGTGWLVMGLVVGTGRVVMTDVCVTGQTVVDTGTTLVTTTVLCAGQLVMVGPHDVTVTRLVLNTVLVVMAGDVVTGSLLVTGCGM